VKIRVSSLLSSEPSPEALAWGTSVLVHVIGITLGVLGAIFWQNGHSGFGDAADVDLVAQWSPPPDPPVVDIAPMLPPELLPPRRKPIIEPDTREPSPPDEEVRRPATETVKTEDAAPPAPMTPRRNITAAPEEPPRADASSLPTPRRHKQPRLPDARARVSPPPAARITFDELPRKLPSNPEVPYPPEARARRQQGNVLLKVQLDAEGLVRHVSVARSSGFASLDQAALDTVRTWRFEPARLRGEPVPIEVTVPVRFTVRGE